MSNSPAQPGPNDSVLALCHMLSNRIGRAFSHETDKFGISVAEWRVILTLALHEKASSREITSRWAMDKMAVSRAVSRLEEQELIVKRQNAKDKRSFDLYLTDTGYEMYKKMLPTANKHYHRLVSGLNKSETTAFRKALIKLIMQVDEFID